MATTVSHKVVRLGAVEFVAALKAASSKQDVKLERAREMSGGKFERITRKDLGAESEVEVTTGDAVYGVWDGDDFKPISTEALEAIKSLGETEQVGKDVKDLAVLEIEEFVPVKDVDFARSESSYFLAPQKGGVGAKPMKLLYEVLKAKKAAGLFKFVVKGGGRQKLGVIHAHPQRGLLVNVLAFAGDVAQAEESREAIDALPKPEKVYIDHAGALVDALTKDASESLLATAKDTAVEAKAEAVEQALAGKAPKPRKLTKVEQASGVDDLLERLKASVKVAA